MPSGVEGAFNMTAKLVVDDGVDNPTEGEIFRAQISWDSPMFG
jgi:hypothetical protein